MNHNPHNLEIDHIVILDNTHGVMLVELTPNSLLAKVRNIGEENTWEVMTNRLSPLPSKEE